MKTYIALPNTWFDAGTVAELIDDYRPEYNGRPGPNSGLFLGIKDGKPDEEICGFEEFEIVEG